MTKKETSFEENILRLEEIVGLLEKGDTQLADSLRLFEEGTRLLGVCGKQLDAAEQKVSRLSKGPDGAPEEHEYTGEAVGNGR